MNGNLSSPTSFIKKYILIGFSVLNFTIEIYKKEIVLSLRHGGQYLWEHIPFIPVELIDILQQRWIISGTPIPYLSKSYQGRIYTSITKTLAWWEIILHGQEITIQAKKQLHDIFIDHDFSQLSINPHVRILSILFILTSIIYYKVTKKWDYDQAKQQLSSL